VYKSDDVHACDESEFIDEVAKYLGVKSNQIEPNVQDIPNEHQRMIYFFDTPPVNTYMSGWHTFKLVSKVGVVVTLDGQGADEQLAGYLSYLPNFLTWQKKNILKSCKELAKIPGATPFILIGAISYFFRKNVPCVFKLLQKNRR